MSFLEILQVCRSSGIRLAARDGKLVVSAAPGAVSAQLRERLAQYKAEIVEWLTAGGAPDQAPIEKLEDRPDYPLSFSQQRLWFIDQLEGGSAQYNIPTAFGLKGALDVVAMQRALDAIIERHAVLRTVFEARDGEPVQVVRPAAPVQVEHVDLSDLDEAAQAERIEQLSAAEARRPFDLARDAMFRCCLVRRGELSHAVLFTMHHIASDGWSMGILAREFIALYEAFSTGAEVPLPPLPVQYTDFACWQRRSMEGGSLERELSYWQDKLARLPAVHSLPLDRPRPAVQSFGALRHGQVLDKAAADALRQLGRQHEATLFMVLQAAFAALLAHWSGEPDIVMGVPNAGRSRKELAPLIGFFINTLIFRTNVADDATVAELIGHARHTALEAFANANVPFDLLNDALKPERSLAYNALCQVKFVLQNHESTELRLSGLELEAIGRGSERVHFDLDLTVNESANGLHLSWTYKDELFEAATIERMASAYARLLGQMVARPQARLSELEWLDPEQAQTLAAWSSGPTSTRYRDATLPVQIAAQARRTPQAVAVRDADGAMDYASLDAAANRLAQALAEQGLGRGARVGVHLERSRHLLVALLGVMKSGAAYVVLDPRQPAGRLQAIVADAALTVVVQDSRQPLALAGVDALYVDDAAAFADYAATAPADVPVADDSVYVLYTSGSSGTPKGVDVRHGGLTDYCAFAREGYWAEHLAGSLVATSAAFDLTVPSLYVPLLEGRCVELLPAQDELAALASRLDGAAAAPVLLRLTPSHVQGLLALSDAVARPQAHVFVIGGEAFGVELARALQVKYPQAQVYNHYGPTETVVGCSWYAVTPQLDALSRTIPIGRPMSNTVLRVLDGQGRPVPVGVAGELYIGGAGVARGYVNRPELTASKFVADPQGGEGRLYRSGDRVRWRNDGTLEFLGRLDDQVKLRGFRIELGDIESRLRAQAAVREAVVLVRGEGSEARLVAYVVPSEPSPSDGLVDALKAQLAGQLPAYMHPSAYVVLERLPLTVNGKLDKAALPAPAQVEAVFAAPEGATETALAAIWSTVLKREGIGRESNFFELGGHSLLATRIVSEVARQFGKPVPVRALFEHPTLRQLAAYVEAQAGEGYAPIPAVAREGRLPLSFAQQRLWFIDRLEGGSAQYNMPTALRLRGALDAAALQQALDALVARHEVLRTTYVEVEGEAVQVVHPAAPVAIAHLDLAEQPADTREATLERLRLEEAGQRFDLARDPMLRCTLVRLGPAEHALLLTVHHIASDGWSNRVLVREFVDAYEAHARQRPLSLAPLPVQYADYAAWQRSRLQGERLEQGLQYWRGQLAGLPAVHSLPLDRPRPAQQRFAGRAHQQVIDAALAELIQQYCRARNVTLFVFLQTTLAVLFSRFSRETDIVMGTPVAGRVHKDVEGLVGLFINTLVLRTDLSGNPRFDELLERNRKTVLDAYTHQEIPFEMLVDELRPARSLSHNPLVQILINSFESTDEAAAPLQGLTVEPLRSEASEDLSKADLTLYTRNLGQQLFFNWSYRTSLFEHASILRLADSFATLLAEVVAAPDRRVLDYALLSVEERAATLERVRPERTAYDGVPVHERVARIAASDPRRPALQHAGAEIDYLTLDARAGALGARLAGIGTGPGDVVAIFAERGIDYAVAVLAVLKTGAAYAPIAVELPDSRIGYMLHDSGARVVLVGAGLQHRLPAGVDAWLLQSTLFDPADPVAFPALAADAASHVLYTSGSTGEPKGVVGTHGALVNRVAWMHERFPFADGEVCCLITSTAFVRAVWELLVPLSAGQKVVVVDADQVKDLEGFAGLLQARGVTRIVTAPSLARVLIELPDAARRLAGLRYWFVSGEPLKYEVAQRMRATVPGATVCNLYGSTETMSDVSYHVVGDATPERTTVPVGRAIANSALLVLDEQQRPVPPGMPGEICVAGLNVALGYLHRPELTQEKFVPHSFDGMPGERLYRTGDLGRMLEDGEIECLGRMDYQVKVRGFRIELGEIEARLLRSERVKDAVVLLKGQGDDAHLVAYVVPEAGQAEGWLDELKPELRAWLPDYMQPAAYVAMPAFPLTPNGKISRRELPEPDYQAQAYAAPEGTTETALAAIWSTVLKREGIGRESNFFELGGHSLLATRIVSEVARQFGKPVPVRALFEHPTLRQLAAYVEAQAGEGYAPIPAVAREGRLPLSFAQQRLWFIDRLEGGSAQYNMPTALRLRGALDAAALQQALDALVARHEVLRTTYVEVEGEAVQVVHPAAPVALAVEDLRALAQEAREAALQRHVRAEAAQPFDLAHDPMLRVRLLVLEEAEHAVLLTMHHIASDGWSVGVLVREFVALYGAFAQGAAPSVPALAVQYADYAAWQRERLQGATLQAQLDYWRGQLAGLPAVHGLPLDRPRPAQQRFEGARVERRVDAATLAALQGLARAHDASLFMVLQAAFAVLLGRWSGESDIVVGTPIAGRLHKDVEPLIGFFVNTLVLRTDLSGNPTFTELLGQVRATALAAYGHQEVPFEMLVDELRPVRSLSHAPLFQVLLSLRNNEQVELALPGLEVTSLGDGREQAKFDLQLVATETDQGLRLSLLYATSLFDEATIARMGDGLAQILSGTAAAPETPIEHLPLLSATDRDLLAEWNATEHPFPHDRCIHELIQAQVERSPEAVALVFGDDRLSYRALNTAANRIAHRLLELGVAPDECVGVCMERSPHMVLAILGILKAGAAYVPLDPQFPPARLSHMLADCGARIVLTQQHLTEVLPVAGQVVLALDQAEVAASLATRPGHNPLAEECGVGSRHLAYVIYTSGSTGQPKGVGNEHRALVNRLHWMQQAYPLTQADRVLQKTPYSFDVSVWEFLWPLTAGASLVVLEPQAHTEPERVCAAVRTYGITTLHFVPSMLGTLLSVSDWASCASVRQVFCSGEALGAEVVARFFATGTSARLHNLYGPTEAAIDVSCWECRPRQDALAVPIGRPIQNVQLHVLDAHGRQQPVGVPGELYIGGQGLARGYCNKPDLTAERFVPDTLAAAGGRLYRTGDRARWRADGVLEFLGRLDFQVKLRGLRIELGEIESHLVRDPAVADAVLTVCGEGEDARLVAYVATGDAAAVERLKAALSAQVPAYMQPSTYVVLDRLPLNANGKVDRRALPAPDLAAVDAHAPPQTPTEAALAEIWQRLLRLETVGVEANFFELGGHSLLATRVTSEIAKTLGKPLPVRAIFEHTTVRQLAAHLDRQAQAQYIAIPTAASDGPLPLSFAQQRLWFVDRFEGGSLQYNLPAALRLTGQLDVGALQHALDTVVERHAVLRTVYRSEHGEAAQWIQPPTPLAIGRVDLRRLPASERDAAVERHIRTEAAKPFDLSADLMLRCTLLQLGDDDWVLLFTTHHIASDGWSRGILVGEFVALYKAHVEGIAPVLPALPLQYADFAAWQRDEAQAEVLQRDLAYWRDQLHDLPRVHSLPLDRPRPDRQAFQAGRVTRRVGRPVMEGLYALAREHDATVFMVLHSALAVLVGRWSNEVDVVIGTPVAGRTRKELEGLIGFFINSLVLRTDLSDNPSFRELLRRNRTMTLDAYAHQSAPFEMLVEAVKPDRHPSHAPLYQIVMAMQNHERAALALPGVDIRSEGAGDAATIDLDLHVSVVELDDGLQLRWTYASSIFDENTIERLADSFGVLLDAIVQDSGRPVLQVPVLPVQDTTRLAVWGMAGRTESPPLCAHELFEQHVRRQPDAIAAVFDGEAIGYAELNAQANRVAHYLRGRGVTPDTLVALCVERSLDLLVGVLGILKAGAAYLPLDPGYPQERLAGILDDAGIANALVHAEVSEAQPSLSERTLLLMDGHLRHLMLADQPETDLSVNDIGLTQGHLAYAIYTSGSTGKPKGVQLEHRGLVNLARNHELLYGLSPASRVLAFASIGFDGATWEWLMALAQGACLYICHEEDRYSAKRLGAFLLEHRITHAAIPPALLGQIDPSPAYALEVLIVAGEACDERLAWTWAQRTRVCNSYGPSEATVAATHAEIVPNQRITLGRPLANVEVLLLNEHRQRQPIGVPGELCLAGAGVARGYLHRPELDAERFFPHPDGYRTAGRVYRTGDLACWTPTGEIQFLGRMDQQVKIRGFRIELGEIESVLAAHALVDKAVVVPIDGEAGIRLAAYVVVVEGDEAAILDPGALAAVLRGAMRARLPDYMVPSVFMTVPSLPLTANGKVDRKALPMPDTQAYGEYVAPEGPIEAALVELWAQVLDLDAASISATASFFDLGGHSILAIKLVSRLAERFGGTLAVRDLFDQPSVRELAAFIQEQADDGVERAWSPLVPLDAGHGLPIMYCVPAGGLTASSYAALALALKGRMGFKVLEPRGMDGRSSPCERMEEIVTLNVEAVLADDPQGPYLLAGHSFGGAVAFEMARLLEARGRAVRLLLLDSTVYPRTGEEPAPSAAAFLARLTSNPSREAPSTENAQCDRAAVTDALGRMLADLGAPAAKDALHLADHLVRVLDAQLAIYRSYRPSGMLSGTATLVQADGGSIRRTPATIVAGHYAVAFATPLQVRTVEGGHLTMLAPRHVASLAAALLAVSEGTQAAGVEV